METRFNGNVVPFASNSTSGERTVFGDWNTESDDINDNLNDDFIAGWENGLEGTLNPYPPSQYFNAALYTSTKLIAYLYQQGIAEWNTTQEYKTNSITVGSNGNIYKSTIDNNIGNNPTTDSVNWNIAFDSSLFVKLIEDQDIDGIKTFLKFPITPSLAPTSDYQVANKKYVDENNGLGYGQTWQDVKSSRSSNVTYTNTTGKPIMVSSTGTDNSVSLTLYADNVAIAANSTGIGGESERPFVIGIIPSGSTYKVTGTITLWSELR